MIQIIEAQMHAFEFNNESYNIRTFKRTGKHGSDDFGYKILETGVGGVGWQTREEALGNAELTIKEYFVSK